MANESVNFFVALTLFLIIRLIKVGNATEKSHRSVFFNPALIKRTDRSESTVSKLKPKIRAAISPGGHWDHAEFICFNPFCRTPQYTVTTIPCSMVVPI